MGAFHIVFIAVNLAIPGWLYFRSSNDSKPKISWDTFEEQMDHIVTATGDFGGCNKDEVVKVFYQLCERSMDEWTEKDSVIMERAAPDIVFTCEVRSDATFVQWRVEQSSEYDLNCQPARNVASDNASPAFVFDRKGELSAIEFGARTGERQSINVANCKKKMKLAQSRGTSEFPRLKSDPRDVATANRMCAQFIKQQGLGKSE